MYKSISFTLPSGGVPSTSLWKIDSFKTFAYIMPQIWKASRKTWLRPGKNEYRGEQWARVEVRM